MGDTLSLAQAAKLAGVTAVTMRKWVDEVPDMERGSKGEYRIPKESLMGYLAGKAPPKVKGASKAKTPDSNTDIAPDSAGGHMLEYLRAQLTAKDRMIGELRSELKEAQGEVRKLEAELRAHLTGGLTSSLSRWIKGR